MSARPGMADGRAFGLAPYFGAAVVNAHLMDHFGVSDAAAYRQALYLRGSDITKTLFEESYRAMDPVDQGCLNSQQPAPSNARPRTSPGSLDVSFASVH